MKNLRNSFVILCSTAFCFSLSLAACNKKGGTSGTSVPDGYYLVTFDTKGGTEIASQTVKSGAKATKPAQDPVNTGSTFTGWYKEFEAVTPFNFDDPITSTTTIFAGFEPDRESFYPGGGTSEGGGGGGGTKTTVYLNPGVWETADAWYAAYVWTGGNNKWYRFTVDTDHSGYYKASIDTTTYTNVIFTRMNPASTAMNWENKWNQTGNLTFDNNCYSITAWGPDGGASPGSWSHLG